MKKIFMSQTIEYELNICCACFRQRQVAHLYALFNNELNGVVNDTCLQAGNEAD